MPQEGDEMLTQKERILFPKEKYFNANIHQMETIRFEEKNDKELQDESAKDDEIQKMRKALDEGSKEMKGIALGLCQWKNGYLWHQGKIWVPNKEEIRVYLIR